MLQIKFDCNRPAGLGRYSCLKVWTHGRRLKSHPISSPCELRLRWAKKVQIPKIYHETVSHGTLTDMKIHCFTVFDTNFWIDCFRITEHTYREPVVWKWANVPSSIQPISLLENVISPANLQSMKCDASSWGILFWFRFLKYEREFKI